MIELLGTVIINTLDANTLELLDTKEQHNVITKYFYSTLINRYQISSSLFLGDIYISTDTAPSYEDWCNVTNCSSGGFLPSGLTSPQFYPAVDAIPPYVQLMRRFNAPGSTRNINSILLPYNTTVSTFSSYSALAYVKLTAPCVQTNTQILDVYYRVQVVNISSSYNFNKLSITPTRLLNSLFALSDYSIQYNIFPHITSNGGHLPIYSHVNACNNTNPTDIGALYPNCAANRNITKQATLSATPYPLYNQVTYNWSYTTTQDVGHLLGALSIFPGRTTTNRNTPVMTTINLDAPNGSKIQPIFSHAASTLALTTANPFLDTIPSSGTGTLNYEGTWATGNLPELYKIEIIAGGSIGTATYTFSKRNHVGFVGANYNTDISSLPGIYNYSGYNFTKPHTCCTVADMNTVGGYGERMEVYDSTHFIMYDTTGVSRYNCADNSIELWDSTTTPALSATNIRQAAVNPGDGTIWVACANTGIYKISADGLSITNYTTSNGLPTNNCYAIDIGRNNAVWALCNGGIVTSDNNGATWTTYNAGTTPAFNSAAITGDWSSVNYMRVDPTHVNDRMCFVRKENCSFNNTKGFVWWDRGTGVTVDTTIPSFVGAVSSESNPRRCPSMFNVSDNDGLWIVLQSSVTYTGITYNAINKLTYGSSTYTSVCPASGFVYPNVMFARNTTNTQDTILQVQGDNTGGYNTWYYISTAVSSYMAGIRTVVYDNTLSLLYSTSSTTYIGSLVNAAMIYSDIPVLLYLGNGIIVGSKYEGYGRFGFILALTGDSTPTSGTIEYLAWQKYGWDGTNWVLGNTTPKTTHSDAQPLMHGITARFTNGVSGTSFIGGDYYTGSVNDGILKNNAMTVAGSHTMYVLPTQNLFDFDGVIRLYPWTTGAVTWRKVSASLTINGDNSLTNNIPYRSYNLSAGSKNRVFGDFSISGTFSVNANQYYAVGITYNHLTEAPNILTSYNTWSFNLIGNDVTIVNSSNTTVNTPPGIGSTTTWNITRVGNTLTFYTAGLLRYTVTDAAYSFCIRARYRDTTNGTNAFTVNPITVDSSESGYYVGLGNSGTGTGIYNTKQLLATIVNISDVSINGTPLTVLDQTPVNIPASGGAALAPEEGLLFFNSADVGKTVTGSYIMNYQVSTPCNIIPV